MNWGDFFLIDVIQVHHLWLLTSGRGIKDKNFEILRKDLTQISYEIVILTFFWDSNDFKNFCKQMFVSECGHL